MKKLKTIFTAVVILLAVGAFASPGPEKVTERVKAEFERNFAGAVNANWQKNDDFYFVTFKLNEREVTAAYNETGEFIGASRIIATSQLPLSISLAIADKYGAYVMHKTITEMTFEGQTHYYVTIENDKKILKLKCAGNGDISVISKTKK